MAEFGNTSLQLLLLLSTWCGALALVGVRRRSRAMLRAARLSLYATALVASVAMVVLAYAFVVSDFSLMYVQHYSDRAMPFFYRLTAVWGGQEGSLLFWTWLLAVASALAIRANQERLRDIVPHAIVVLMVVQVFFCVLLLLISNPFDTFLGTPPGDGKGLNPLLLNPYMVIHPPALYVGYVGMSIPFAFALAALIAGRTDDAWIQAARPWALGSWAFLSLGLVLGMLWAYEELGWGGYWAWDPVENAGLFPWLTATAYLHSVMVQERRGMFKVWNVSLAALTFLLTILGTFDTRSGLIQSVHAFAQSEIGYYFLAFMGLVLVVSAAVIVWRLPLLRTKGDYDLLSRESFFGILNWILLIAAFMVILLTHLPALSQLFGGHKITINPAAFTRWMTPIGLALLFLKGVGPMMSWRRSPRSMTGMLLVAAGLLSPSALILFFAMTVRRPMPLLTFCLSIFVVGNLLREVMLSARLRRRRTGADVFSAVLGMVARNRRRYGGYMVHAGVALMFVGFGGEAYKLESEVQLARGQRTRIGSYTLRYDDTKVTEDEQKNMTTTTLSLYRGEERLGTMHPGRWVFFKHENQPQTKVDIRRTLKEDLFVAFGSYDPRSQVATFKAMVNPLVNWIWIGFVLLWVGASVAISPRRRATALAADMGAPSRSLPPSGVNPLGPPDMGAPSRSLPPAAEAGSSHQLLLEEELKKLE